VKGLYGSGRFVAVEGGHAVFAFDGEPVRDLAEGARPDVEAALSAHFNMPIPVRLVVAPGGAASAAEAEEPVDVSELRDAPSDARTGVDLLAAELGAEPVDGDS
jgi:hypothetical protein